MKKLNTLLFFYALLLFFHSYSAFSFSLKKSFSLVREKFGQLSVPKKILMGYFSVTVPYELWKIGSFYSKLENDRVQFLLVKRNVINSLRNIFIFPLGVIDIFIFPFCLASKKCSSLKQWDKKDSFHKDFFYNPVFAGISIIANTGLQTLHNSAFSCRKKFNKYCSEIFPQK